MTEKSDEVSKELEIQTAMCQVLNSVLCIVCVYVYVCVCVCQVQNCIYLFMLYILCIVAWSFYVSTFSLNIHVYVHIWKLCLKSLWYFRNHLHVAWHSIMYCIYIDCILGQLGSLGHWLNRQIKIITNLATNLSCISNCWADSPKCQPTCICSPICQT